MQENFKISALLHIRSECFRDGKAGIEHVDALLRLRGFDPDDHRPTKRKPVYFKRRELTRTVLALLKDRPRTSREISQIIAQRTGQDWNKVRDYVSPCLSRAKKRGLVVSEKTVWSLV